MTTIPDLSQCSYVSSDPALLAIGWLGREAVFQTGPVAEDVFRKLETLCTNPWQPFATAGKHDCELCQYSPAQFGKLVFVPGKGCVYVAPVGIVHYIAAHWYRPPAPFLEAVINCPSMNSMAYKRALLDNGARPLMR